jgi:hypothetical protein
VERVAGLDVGKELVVVCVRTPGRGRPSGIGDAELPHDEPLAGGRWRTGWWSAV